ncbi:tyrosine-type recombinase/integrase [Bacillus stercoris]|uniref:tyrosine-type recombinase/integrase n=1 Tax=Bacillus stercoris TaxID=2054641 RepID=UPI003CED2D51
MAKLGNIVQLNIKNDNSNVYGTIRTYLDRKGQNSKQTKETYERQIRDFFKTMRNKDIENLTPEDLIFTKKQIVAYQVALKEQFKGATVNNAITAIRECYRRLEDDGFAVSHTWFNVERYDEHDSQKYGTLSHEEVVEIINLVSKTRKGNEKALLIRLAYATAFRKDTLMTMKWNQIVNINDIWYAKVLGKGNKWSYKKLSDDLYHTLMKFKEDSNASDNDKIFKLTDKTIKKMMKYIRENMDFGDRWIVFHSFKKASINEVNVISGGDIKAMQAHGDHADAKTTLNRYLAEKQMEELVVVDINTEIPLDKFDEMSKDELIALIKSADRNTQIRLLHKAGLM